MSEGKPRFTRLREWWRRIMGAPARPPAADLSVGTGASKPREASIELPSGDEPIVIPARGDVFDLHLTASFHWWSDKMTQQVLEGRISAYQDNARHQVLNRAWPTARQHGPMETVAVEDELKEQLATGWCYEDTAGSIRCTPTVHVLPDPRLRELLLPFRTREVHLNEERALELLRADKSNAVAEVWLGVIKTLEKLDDMGRHERQFFVPFVAALADGGGFANVMRALAAERRQRTVDLAGVLEHAQRGHEQAGLFEFANAYDKTLEAFCRQMGLEPFSSVLANFGEPKDGQAGTK